MKYVGGNGKTMANLRELKTQFRGKKFNGLIEHHINSQTPQERQNSMFGTIAMLPQDMQHLSEYWIDYGNQWINDPNFWTSDGSTALTTITNGAKEFLEYHDLHEYVNDDETLFNMFQILVLNYAYTASVEPNFRKFIGIQKAQKQTSGCLGVIMFIVTISLAIGYSIV
jgi:hypothetical protein